MVQARIMKKLLFIVGPTGSGKTAFAVKCAKMLNTDIISCDSMQIYKNMDIGTAKVTVDEADGVRHHMIDIVEADKEFSVAEYRDEVLPIIDKMLADNKTPVICGGTGLYVDAILYPLNFSNTCKNSALRQHLMAELNDKGSEYMHEKLKSMDEKSALKIHMNDTKRLIRALEINMTIGKRVENQLRTPEYDYLMILFSPADRADLYNKINERVDKMFENGLENEVKTLIDSGLTFDCQSMQAIGYKEFKDYFDGDIDRNTLIEQIKQHTRNYAKRQLTWFRKYDDIVIFERQNDAAYQLVKYTFNEDKQ